jgi:hypothetical protein
VPIGHLSTVEVHTRASLLIGFTSSVVLFALRRTDLLLLFILLGLYLELLKLLMHLLLQALRPASFSTTVPAVWDARTILPATRRRRRRRRRKISLVL